MVLIEIEIRKILDNFTDDQLKRAAEYFSTGEGAAIGHLILPLIDECLRKRD